MTTPVPTAYRLGYKHAQDTLGLTPLLPKQDRLFLQQLAMTQPLSATQPSSETDYFSPDELQQLGQLSRIAVLSPNPLMKLTGRLASKALNATAEKELTNAPIPPQGI